MIGIFGKFFAPTAEETWDGFESALSLIGDVRLVSRDTGKYRVYVVRTGPADTDTGGEYVRVFDAVLANDGRLHVDELGGYSRVLDASRRPELPDEYVTGKSWYKLSRWSDDMVAIYRPNTNLRHQICICPSPDGRHYDFRILGKDRAVLSETSFMGIKSLEKTLTSLRHLANPGAYICGYRLPYTYKAPFSEEDFDVASGRLCFADGFIDRLNSSVHRKAALSEFAESAGTSLEGTVSLVVAGNRAYVVEGRVKIERLADATMVEGSREHLLIPGCELRVLEGISENDVVFR